MLDLIAYALSSKIKNRKDLDLWRKRHAAGKKLFLRSYLIGGAVIGTLMTWVVISSSSQSTLAPTAFSTIFISSCCCGGPAVLFITVFLFSGGMREYARLMTRMESSGRVCSVCNAVALYGNDRIEPSKRRRETHADLVPHMNAIKEDGQVHVLCDACLAEVNAIDSA